jgi:hypothetical protein
MRKNILQVFRLSTARIFKCLFLSLLIFSGCSDKEESFYINLDKDALTFEYKGGNQTITVSSNGEWTVSGETDWCKVSPKTGNGNSTVTVTVLENESVDERKATLTFRCGAEAAVVEIMQTADWVLINGVRWATCNVGESGTFVENPEDYGGYYQWGRNSTDFTPVYGPPWDWSDPSNPNLWGATKTANDPSPAGYRVPTRAEIYRLYDETFVTSEWTARNGVSGRRFTDKLSGKSIFLPAAGYRYVDGSFWLDVNVVGYYWSSTASGTISFFLGIDIVGMDPSGNGGRASGCNIRSVRE